MRVKLKGTVARRRVGEGTKSEHVGVVFDSPEGVFKLRRKGGNAFRDEVLEGLVGKEIVCEGEATDSTLIMTGWIVAGESEA